MINTKISGMLYTSNEQSEKEIKKTISLVIVSRIKYLAINLTQEAQDLYSEQNMAERN